MDTLIYYARDVGSACDVGSEVRAQSQTAAFRTLRPSDGRTIEEIARRSFTGYKSHYHADPHFDRITCDLIYEDGARRLCRDRSVADDVIVVERDGSVAGFATLKARVSSEIEIPLVAVDPRHRRRGVYADLLAGAVSWTRTAGSTIVFSSTQIVNLEANAAGLTPETRVSHAALVAQGRLTVAVCRPAGWNRRTGSSLRS